MKKSLIVVTLLAGVASPATAAVLDFTTSGIGTGNTTGSVLGATYSITGSGTLADAQHWNNVGCTGEGWNFACDGSPGDYDVGFGVSGNGNNNEVDLTGTEWVQVAFDRLVKVLGFAGMLTYDRNPPDVAKSPNPGTETVILEYSSDNGSTWNSVVASALFKVNEAGTSFDTVGLAYRSDFAVSANKVRFMAGGISPYDDGNANITAAGLEVAPVPLPATLPLLAVGLGVFGMVGLRRKQAKAA